jgi:ribosome assembly protein YihI (activator of Der GTPase)
MLTESIFNIKSELGQLNEKQIPELKGIENSVNEAELVNMELKEELNQVLDAIENTEQSFLMSLESALSNCAFCAEQIPGLFVE